MRRTLVSGSVIPVLPARNSHTECLMVNCSTAVSFFPLPRGSHFMPAWQNRAPIPPLPGIQGIHLLTTPLCALWNMWIWELLSNQPSWSSHHHRQTWVRTTKMTTLSLHQTPTYHTLIWLLWFSSA